MLLSDNIWKEINGIVFWKYFEFLFIGVGIEVVKVMFGIISEIDVGLVRLLI